MRWIALLFTAGCNISADKNASSDWSYETDANGLSSSTNEENTWLSGFQTVNSGSSSSSIQVRWNRPENVNVTTFRLVCIDQLTNEDVELWIAASLDTATIPDLKSDTDYLIELSACLDSSCSAKIASDYNQLSARTATERWSLQGSGDSFSDLSPLISGEHLQAHPYASSSGLELYIFSSEEQSIWKRTLQIYDNVSLETTSVDQQILDCASDSCNHILIEAIQMVPSEDESDQLLVLAQNNGSSSEIYVVTPQNTDASSFCQLEVDCSLSPFFQSSDIILSDFYLHRSGEQSFLLLEGYSACTDDSGFYVALLNSETWEVVTDISGCPRMFADAAVAPSVQNSNNHFNLYFTQADQLRVLYGPSANGSTVSSWETIDTSREVELTWTSGTPLSLEEEQKIVRPSVFFSESKHLFFSVENSETQSYGIYFATLLNP